MTAADLSTLFDYGYWANAKLLEVVSRLSDEEFTRSVAGGYGSVRNTLVHMMSAEAGWMDRCGGPPRGPKFNPDDFPTVASVTERWVQIERQMREFLSTLTDDDVHGSVEFIVVPGTSAHVMKVGELLQHAVIHGVHHRGQVAMLLRAIGHVPGNFDAFFYYGEKSHGTATV